MQDVGFLEINNAIAVGMRIALVLDLYLFAIQSESDRVIKGNYRQGHLWGGGYCRAKSLHFVVCTHALMNIIVGYNQNTFLAQILIASGVIIVPVRIDQELDRLIR